MPKVKISHSVLQANNSTLTFTHSDLPSQEHLTLSSASSVCSDSSFTATIPAHDSQLFVTDHQLTWLSQPQSSRLPTPTSPTATSTTPDSASDFVLFPSSSTQSRSERGLVTSRTDPNFPSGSAFTGHQLAQSRRRNTTHLPNTVSPIPNKRQVSNQYPGSSSATSSNGIHSGQHSRSRPPVPLFANNNSCGINYLPPKPAMSALDTQGKSRSSPNNSPELMAPKVMNEFLDESKMDQSPSLGHQAIDFGFEESHDPNIMASIFAPSTFASPHVSATQSYDSLASTVSPHDIMSATASGAMTDLTTPDMSYDESPPSFSNDTSPQWYNHDSALISQDQPTNPELSFFPSLNEIGGHQTHAVAQSPTSPTHPVAAVMSRTESSSTHSVSQISHKSPPTQTHSSTSRVSKQKRKARNGPLPPIIPDPNKPLDMKRARNTMAARASRQRKQEKVDALEQRVEDLETQLEYWKSLALAKQSNH